MSNTFKYQSICSLRKILGKWVSSCIHPNNINNGTHIQQNKNSWFLTHQFLPRSYRSPNTRKVNEEYLVAFFILTILLHCTGASLDYIGLAWSKNWNRWYSCSPISFQDHAKRLQTIHIDPTETFFRKSMNTSWLCSS
jgi:hypothetical protein